MKKLDSKTAKDRKSRNGNFSIEVIKPSDPNTAKTGDPGGAGRKNPSKPPKKS